MSACWACLPAARCLPRAPGTNAKRGIYQLSNLPTNYNSNNVASAVQGVQTCNSMPGSTQADPSSWLNGFSWALGYPWHTVTNSYVHYNTPNKLTCITPNDGVGPYLGRYGRPHDGKVATILVA